MRFEHCEPRLALSTTTFVLVSQADAAPFDAASLEGGSIAWDLVPESFSGDGRAGVQVQFGLANDKSVSLMQTVPMLDLQNRENGIGNSMLNDADLAQPDILLGDLDAVSEAYSGSPIKPIDPPTNEPQHHEGGAIALAPFTSPDSFGRFDRESQLADRQRGPSKALERGLSARQLPTNEGLRGRAVVFEVAQNWGPSGDESRRRSESATPADMSKVEAVLASRDSTLDSERNAARIQSASRMLDAAAPSASNESRSAAKSSERLLAEGAESILAPSATDLNGDAAALAQEVDDPSVRLTRADRSARDAALADFDAIAPDELRDEAPPIAAGLRDRTLIGVALALVAGYRPATKLVRGRRTGNATEQRPPRQRG